MPTRSRTCATLSANFAGEVEQSAPMGLLITNGEFVSFHGPDPTTVTVAKTHTGSVRFVNCAFWGPCNQIARVAGRGTVGFSDCTFVQWDRNREGRHALQVESGTFLHYTYDLGKAPISDELNVSVWLKANRPGVQLLCRVVLPRERDPRKPDQPLTTLIRGEPYSLVSRWQQLTIRQPVKRLREQQQLLQAELKREVVVTDAYVDRVVAVGT